MNKLTSKAQIPSWAEGVLRAPGGRNALSLKGDRWRGADGAVAAIVQDGVVRFPIAEPNDSIAFYRSIGGAHFHERRSVPYAMTTLDTPIYRGYLENLRFPDPQGVIVDVGGGDGRNALPWLEWGYLRVVVVDPAFDALARLRTRTAAAHPEWVERLLLIEADARQLPLANRCATRVQAVEALAYLNEDYSLGLSECARLLDGDASLLIADRDYEAGLLTRLFYRGGIEGMLSQVDSRSIIDGNGEKSVKSRCFTAGELRDMIESSGLRIVSERGISAFSLILGYERSNGRIARQDEAHLDAVHAFLARLGESGAIRRSHVFVASLEG